ncbi:MAG: alpha/beta fold hydrolase, partial [Actinobacteria bacterium]|nr:alpha/beta fold hydrolase [Actinomycetota bacterium]
MGRSTERIEFTGSGGGSLSAVIDAPGDGDGRGLVLAHCFTCSKDLPTMVTLARGLVAAGHTVLRFDFTGLGDSEGDFADTTLSTDVDDVARAVAALSDRGVEPVGAVGHSFGGLAVLLATHRLPTVRAVAVVNTPCGTGHLRGVLADAEDRIRAEGRADVRLGGRPVTIGAALLDDLDD